MEAWQWLAISGLAAGVIGAYLVYRVTTELILKAEITFNGEVADTSLERVKWPNRIGWGLIGVGFVAQGVSVVLSGG